jgi:tripartite-type tricarboxylate transporter receptor subunit TctC
MPKKRQMNQKGEQPWQKSIAEPCALALRRACRRCEPWRRTTILCVRFISLSVSLRVLPSDIIARLFAKGAEPLLGQQLVVENKPGAGSSIAAEYVARATNDGYTLFTPALSTLTDEIVNADRSVHLSKDFAPIALLGNLAIVLVVNPETKVRTVAEFIALAKSKPGQLLYASVGAGTLPHLCAVLFEQRAGINMIHVPYPGSPQATADVIAGRVTMFFAPASAIVGQIAAGKLTALATAGDKRASALPDVPTMAEAGIPDFNTPLWLGLVAPLGTPLPVIEKLAGAANTAMHKPEIVEALRQQGYDPADSGPDKFAAFIRSEYARWSAVARDAGLKS